MTEFLADYPEIKVSLLLSNQNLHFVEDHVDIAVRFGSLQDSGMVATRVGSMRTVICASPKLLAGRVPKSPEDLANLECINFDFLAPASSWPFRSAKGKGVVDVRIQPRLTVTSAEAAVWAACEGIGATRVLHYQCADAVRDGALQILLEDFELPPQPIHMLHADREMLPKKTRVFFDFAAGRLRERMRPYE